MEEADLNIIVLSQPPTNPLTPREQRCNSVLVRCAAVEVAMKRRAVDLEGVGAMFDGDVVDLKGVDDDGLRGANKCKSNMYHLRWVSFSPMTMHWPLI